MVYRGGLENRFGLTADGGSNPSLSAKLNDIVNDLIKIVIGAWSSAHLRVLWRKGYLLQLTDYVQQTREELRKCTWPTWDELKGSTVVVTISIVLLGGFTSWWIRSSSGCSCSLSSSTMRSQWFVIHTLSGQEQKVKESIEKRIKPEEMGDFIKEVLVPMEKVVEVRNQKKTVSTRKLWPGYVFMDMALLDENNRIIEKPWYFIKETQGVDRLRRRRAAHARRRLKRSRRSRARFRPRKSTRSRRSASRSGKP